MLAHSLVPDVSMQRSNRDHTIYSEIADENLAAESSPADAGPAATEPADMGLAATEPADMGLAATEPADMGLAATEPADMGLAATEPADAGVTVRIRSTSWKSRLGQIDQIVPALLFLLFYNLGNTVLAVAAATGWSLKAVYSRRRRGLSVGAWLPCLTAYLVLRAAVSIAVEREMLDFGVSAEAVYFGIGIATKVLLGLAAVVTILIGRPFALKAVHWVVVLPETMSSHPRFISALRNVTWVIACYEVGGAVMDIMLYNNMYVSAFLISRQIANFVVSFVLILGTVMYLDRALAQVPGWPGLEQILNPPRTEVGAGEPSSVETAVSRAEEPSSDRG